MIQAGGCYTSLLSVRIRYVILLFGLVNACLYSGLLPLWEGFDEPFHYAYVESLWQTHRFPVLGAAMLPGDVGKSFLLAPVSYIVHRGLVQTTTYDEWSALPQADRERRRSELDRLRPEPQYTTMPNYEAHHPPLAYILLALIDWPVRDAPIATRLLVLRLASAICSVLLLYYGATALCRTLEVPEQAVNAALFTIFCSQMLYATVAHVANDWLAVGISALFLASLAAFVKSPNVRSALMTGLWLGAGLLTKAYFLVFAILAFATAAILLRQKRAPMRTILAGAIPALIPAVPWYARNLMLYRNVSGTYEAFHGIGIRQVLAAARRIDWAGTTGFLARASLWTGNASFTDFSKNTIDIVLLFLLLALGAWGLHRSAIQSAETVVFGAIVLFSVAVAYASCASFANTNGDVPGASPWYTQVLLVPVIALAYLGMSRWKRIGTVLAVCTIAIWTWVFIATWVIKLFPMYSGGGAAPMHVRDVLDWYARGAWAHAHDLSLLALAPASILYAGLLVSLTLALLLSAVVMRSLRARSGPQH
jgi:hypothetical protein